MTTDGTSRVVLLTGATGMVGRELMVRMARQHDTTVVCPVRAASDADAGERIAETLSRMPHQPLADDERSRISAFSGDISLPRMGLDHARWDALADRVTRIVHGAASVSWSQPLDVARRVNVGGTTEMLRLAEAAQTRGRLHAFDYLSTVMVAGRRQGVIGEEELDGSAGYWSSYEQSKAEAEALVRSRKGDLPISVFRLSMVVGDSRSGHTSAFNVMYWPLKMLSRGVFWIVPADATGIVDVVPVDFVADAVEALSADPAQRGKGFHIAAGKDDCCTIGELLDAAAGVLEVRRPILVNPRIFMPIVRPLLYTVTWGKKREQLNKGKVYLPYLAYRARFDISQTRAGLERLGVNPPPRVGQYIGTLIDYAKQVNWGADWRKKRVTTRAA
jgi:long-chain acyl-CoA synthetase